MDSDDLEPGRPVGGPRNLEAMSIEALSGYINELEAEIGRARMMIRQKETARNSAASVFKV